MPITGSPQLSECSTPAQRSQSLVESQSTTLPTSENLRARVHHQSNSSIDSGLAPSEVRVRSEDLTYPFLDVEGMSKAQIDDLKGRLTRDYMGISGDYNTLTQNIISSLRNRGITPKQLSSVLMNLNIFSIKKNATLPLLQDQLDVIRKEDSLDDAFYALRSYGSFFDCYVLRHIVNHLGTDVDQQELALYTSKLNDFCQRSIFECPHFSSSDSYHANLVMKVADIVSESFTLSALNTFRVALAEVLCLEEHTMLLHSVEKGCVKFSFQVPNIAVDGIFPLTAEQRAQLRSIGVMELICDKYSVDLSTSQQLKVNICIRLIFN